MTALVLALVLAQAPGQSADEGAPKLNVLSIALEGWNLPLRSMELAFERAITPHLSIAGGLVAEDHAGLIPASGTTPAPDVRQYTGGARLSARWYVQGKAPLGFWFGPMAAAQGAGGLATFALPGGSVSTAADALLLTAGALVGFNGVLPFGIVLQLSGGARGDWMVAKLLNLDQSTTIAQRLAVSPVAYLGVGWAF